MAKPDPLPPPPKLAELLAQRPVALFVDFDGTLVEIASAPHAIDVPANFAGRLQRLSDRLEGRLALVSGRALDNLEAHVGHCRFAHAGSHGASCRLADGTRLGDDPAALPDAAIATMRDFARAHGLSYEHKQHGGAIHFRSTPEAGGAVREFANSLATQHGLDVKAGKAVVELVHFGASKSAAVQLFMAEPPFAGTLPVFLGDDVTDEDGFAAANEAGGFGIAVGQRDSVAARFGLCDVAAVHQWLGL